MRKTYKAGKLSAFLILLLAAGCERADIKPENAAPKASGQNSGVYTLDAYFSDASLNQSGNPTPTFFTTRPTRRTSVRISWEQDYFISSPAYPVAATATVRFYQPQAGSPAGSDFTLLNVPVFPDGSFYVNGYTSENVQIPSESLFLRPAGTYNVVVTADNNSGGTITSLIRGQYFSSTSSPYDTAFGVLTL